MDYNEYKIDSIRQNTKKKVIICIVVIFLILFLLISLFFPVTYFNSKNTSDADITAVDNVNISSGKVFCVVCVDEEKKIEFISLIKSQIFNKTFYITMISPDEFVKTEKGEINLKQHYANGGINELLDAIKIKEDIYIDRYILVTKENLTMIFGEMGHIIADIKTPVTLSVSEGKVNIEAGKQELDYEEICDYLINGCNNENKLIFQGDFICTIMEQYLKNADYSSASSIFSDLINYVDTDISVIDYTSSQDVIASFEETQFIFINTLDN